MTAPAVLPHDAYIDAVSAAFEALGGPTEAWTETPDGHQLDGVIRIKAVDVAEWPAGVALTWDQRAGWAILDQADRSLDDLNLDIYAHPAAVAQRAHDRLTETPDAPVDEYWDQAGALRDAVAEWEEA